MLVLGGRVEGWKCYATNILIYTEAPVFPETAQLCMGVLGGGKDVYLSIRPPDNVRKFKKSR